MIQDLLSATFLLPALLGSGFGVVCLLAVLWLCRSGGPYGDSDGPMPPVTILRPICGLDRQLLENLRSTCRQDYPEYQVVFTVQDRDDPALPLLRQVQQEFGTERVSVAVHDLSVGPNGKVNNLLGGLREVRHDLLVISDSDVRLRPDYLRAIVQPFADPRVGCVHTLFRIGQAHRWYGRMSLLHVNADFLPNAVFAYVTGAAGFTLGPSVAIRRATLQKIGGFEAVSEYLAEDYEIGRRTLQVGQQVILLPYMVDVLEDYPSALAWWKHQVYWDQNARAAKPVGFFASILIRSVPFALLFALTRGLDPIGIQVLAGVLGIRLAAVAGILWRFQDREGLRSLLLMPLQDCLGVATWALSFTQRTIRWRGQEYRLTTGGRMEAHRGNA